MGTYSMFCMKSIPFLGFAPLIATLFALRNGAPEHPVFAGAAAGLFAGAIGAALYACTAPTICRFLSLSGILSGSRCWPRSALSSGRACCAGRHGAVY